jgi:hypothetical protein
VEGSSSPAAAAALRSHPALKKRSPAPVKMPTLSSGFAQTREGPVEGQAGLAIDHVGLRAVERDLQNRAAGFGVNGHRRTIAPAKRGGWALNGFI